MVLDGFMDYLHEDIKISTHLVNLIFILFLRFSRIVLLSCWWWDWIGVSCWFLVFACSVLLVLVMACPKSKFKNGVGKNFGMVFLGFCVVGKEIDRSAPILEVPFRNPLEKSGRGKFGSGFYGVFVGG